MNKQPWNKKLRNATVFEIYAGYREEMERTLALEDSAPQKFTNENFAEYYKRRVDRLDALIALYADLVLSSKYWN